MDQPKPDNGSGTPAPSTMDRSEFGASVRANAAAWRSLLGRGDLVTERPPVGPGEPPVWSALEYGAHVRDRYEVAGERLKQLLTKSDPTFADWDQERAAAEGRYGEQDPAKVAYDLALKAGRVADMVDRVRDKQWVRSGSGADGQAFTVESLIRQLLDDVTRCVVEVERGYEALAPTDDDEGEGEIEGEQTS